MNFSIRHISIVGFSASIENAMGSELRVTFGETERTEYTFISLDGSTRTAPFLFEDASVEYDPSAEPIHPDEVDKLMFHVPTRPGSPTAFDFCIYDLTPITQNHGCKEARSGVCIV